MTAKFLLTLAAVCAAMPAAVRDRQSFDDGWRFHLGDVPGAERANFDDSAWRKLNLPHDWSIEGPSSADNASGTGYLPGGIGWYRKSFPTPSGVPGRHVFLAFDGVYRDSDVWINGHLLGHRPYGYSSFEYDLTPYLATGGPNIVAVRADHSIVGDSRFYTGSGIYRHVWLTVTAPVHVAHWGAYVYTPVVSDAEALVSLETNVVNESGSAANIKVVTSIEDPSGHEVATVASNERPLPKNATFAQQVAVARPKLWSLDAPNLYTAVTRVYTGGTLTDEYRTPFGIRTIRFDPNLGFFLNGRPMKIKGVCVHHDLGALGAAFNETAMERRLTALKQLGVNAIRFSHNPMAPEEYDLCDRLGLLVMDESFDEWTGGKNKWIQGRNTGKPGKDGYNTAFAEWGVRDVEDMVLRDRNHPSVILWSIGNEIDYPNDPFTQARGRGGARPNTPSADTLPAIARTLIAAVKRYDGTRPVTQALADVDSSNATGLADLLDVAGYNYLEQNYARDHQQHPNRIILGSENSHSLQAWLPVAQNPWVAGQFLWTGIDYLGESNRFPDRGSVAGILDYCGFRKPGSYLREALWADHPVVYAAAREAAPNGGRGGGQLVEHWNFAGDTRTAIPVEVYSNLDKVELFLNDKSLGEKQIAGPNNPVLRWDVPFEPGTVRVVAKSNDGTKAFTAMLATAGPAHHIELIPGETRDLTFVEIRIVDAAGHRVFAAADPIEVSVAGAGSLVALDNADPRDTTPVQFHSRKPYQGRALAIVRSAAPGKITVHATAHGLPPAELTLTLQ